MITPSLGPGPAVLAFDVGGTTIKAALVDEAGTAQGIVRVPTPLAGAGCALDVMTAVSQLAEELTAGAAPGARPAAIGISVPGIVDDDTGVGIYSENLGWRDVDFAGLAAARLALPTVIGHDVRSAGLAEMALGAGAGMRNAIVIVLGTGIAAAVLVDGSPVTGGGYAGEIGHAVVVPNGEPCRCGNRGCLEAIASAAAITRRYNRASGAAATGARDVLAAVHAADPVARSVWESAMDALAFGIAHSVAVLAPEIVVLGGGLAEAGDDVLIPVRERLAGLVNLAPPPPVVTATAGENAGVLGSALRARAHLAGGSR